MVNIGEGVMDITAVQMVVRSLFYRPFFFFLFFVSQNSFYVLFESDRLSCCMHVIAFVGFDYARKSRGFEKIEMPKFKTIFYRIIFWQIESWPFAARVVLCK